MPLLVGGECLLLLLAYQQHSIMNKYTAAALGTSAVIYYKEELDSQ